MKSTMKLYLCLFMVCVSFCSCMQSSVKTNKNEKEKIIVTGRAFNSSLTWSDCRANPEYGYACRLNQGYTNCIATRSKKIEAVILSSPKKRIRVSWEMVSVELPEHTNYRYSISQWKLTTENDTGTDRTLYGQCNALWKKQQDGSWKLVSDPGILTPLTKYIDS